MRASDAPHETVKRVGRVRRILRTGSKTFRDEPRKNPLIRPMASVVVSKTERKIIRGGRALCGGYPPRKPPCDQGGLYAMVPGARLELAPPRGDRILSPARLPVPPSRLSSAAV